MAVAWPDSGAAWDSLPAPVRDTMMTCGTEHWREIFAGVASHNKTWRPIRPPMMGSAAFRAMRDVSDRIAQLILEACRRRAGTAGELRERLDVPRGRIRLLDDDESLAEHLLVAVRPDVLMSGGVPRYVEINIDSALGGAFDADNIATRFADCYRASGVAEQVGVHPPPSAVDGRFAAIRSALDLAHGARVAMVMDLDSGYPGMEDPKRFLASMAPVSAAARRAGIDLVPHPLAWLQADDRLRLLADDRPVDAVFRLFVPDKVAPSAGLDTLTRVIQARAVPMFTSSAAWLLGNKGVLAWLWEDVDRLPRADAELLRMHVPYTTWCTAERTDNAVGRRRELVLKPGDGTGGDDVLVGRDVSELDWRDGLARAAKQGGYVLQEYVEAERLAMQFVHVDTGEIVIAAVPYTIGPYLFGRRQCSPLIRIGFPGGGSVLNLSLGALFSGLLIVDEPA